MHLFMLLLLLPALATSLPRFEVHWESELSYDDVDPLMSPWYIRLGDINVGPPGFLGGPNVVTIDSADYCVAPYCQEYYPDEFCSKYPPEGVPNKPRVVEDWGTKYNITGDLVAEGIKSIHERGGQVLLSYGGRHELEAGRSGINAEGGGGGYYATLELKHALWLAERIHKNIVDWDLDGVDFYHLDVSYSPSWAGSKQDPGTSATYAYAVVKNLRELVGNTKTISYSTISYPVFGAGTDPDTAIISAIHPYLDFITLPSGDQNGVQEPGPLSQEALTEIDFLGIPLSKIGILIGQGWGHLPSSESLSEIVGQVKELGMAGVSLFSINSENSQFRGAFAARVAETLYL